MKVNLRKSLFILPNLFTCSSIFCGFYAILICAGAGASIATTEDDFLRASLLIVFAMFFDTIDGRVARLTRTQSAFGVQLDSLADVASFGVAPAVLMYQWSLHTLGVAGAIACFVFVAAGAIRLARFNVLTMGERGAPKKPGKYILGLPIPGAAGILVSVVIANHSISGHLAALPSVVLAVVLTLSFFMVSTIRFRSFKDVRLTWRTAAMVFVAVLTSAVIAMRYHVSVALVWLLTSYVVIGVLESVVGVSGRILERRRLPKGPPPGDGKDDPAASA